MNEKELTCLVSEEISNQFVEAIKNDNFEGLRTLLKVGISINSQIDYKVWNRRSLLCVGGGHQGFTHHVARFERYHALPQFIQPGTLQQRFRIYRHLRLSKKSLGHMCLNPASIIINLQRILIRVR